MRSALMGQAGEAGNLSSALKKNLSFFLICMATATFFAILSGSCWLFNSVSPLPYKPVITFSGIVNNDSVFFPGNRSYPNTCVCLDHCIRMYFYSEDYSQGTISQGDQMRLDVFPPDTQFITERHALFNLIRYSRILATPTYTITAADTINDYNNLHIKAETFERRSGGAVSLKEMSVTARPLGQYASEELTIKRGVVQGRIE
jgi:hypothetical protein